MSDANDAARNDQEAYARGLEKDEELARLKAEVEARKGVMEEWSEETAALRMELATLRASNERMREALEWYRVNAEGCRKVTSEGNEARRNLDKDGGKRARAALTAPAKETDNG